MKRLLKFTTSLMVILAAFMFVASLFGDWRLIDRAILGTVLFGTALMRLFARHQESSQLDRVEMAMFVFGVLLIVGLPTIDTAMRIANSTSNKEVFAHFGIFASFTLLCYFAFRPEKSRTIIAPDP